MFTVRILVLALVALVVAEPEADPAAKKSSFNVESDNRWTLGDLKHSWNTDYYKQFSNAEAPKVIWSTTAAPKLFFSTTEAPKSWPYYNQYDTSRINGFNLYNRFADSNLNKKFLESNYLASLYGNNYPQIPDQTNFQPQIISDKDQTQYILNLSSYKQLSLTVKVRGDFIYVQGREEITPTFNQNFVTLNQFVHTFVLPPYTRGNEVTALLTIDGYLIITAPIRAYGYVSNVDYDVPVIISDQAFLQKPFTLSLEQAVTPQSEPAQPAFETIEANKEEQKPAEKPAETFQEQKPAEKPAETFQEQKPAEKPAETFQEQKPAEKLAETFQEQKPAEKPAETFQEQKPGETFQEQKPAEKPAGTFQEQKPVEKFTETFQAQKPAEKPVNTFQALNFAAQQFPTQQKPTTTNSFITYPTKVSSQAFPAPAPKINPSYLSTVEVIESYSTQKSVQALPGQTYQITYTTSKPTLAVKPVDTLNPKSIVKVRPYPTQVFSA